MRVRSNVIVALGLLGTAIAPAAAQCSASGHAGSLTRVDFQPEKNIVETASDAGSFGTLIAAAKAAGLAEALSSQGPLTVFAPTDEAFAKLGSTVDELLKPENRDQLAAILTYHVVQGRVTAAQVTDLEFAGTLNGQRVDISSGYGGVEIDEASVVQTDIEASNGIIHVIDTVLLPQTRNIAEVATEAGSFGTLLAAANAAGLVPALTGEGPLTVLAPTDEAFNKLGTETINTLLRPENKERLADILKYHVISGRVYSDQALDAGEAETLQGETVNFRSRYGNAEVNGAGIVATDIEASNGVIHVIDEVILPDGM